VGGATRIESGSSLRRTWHLGFVYTQWRRNEFETEGTCPVHSVRKNLPCPSIIWLCKYTQLVVQVSAFVMASTVWSVSCSLFFYSRCPRAQPLVKVGRAPVPFGVGTTVDTPICSVHLPLTLVHPAYLDIRKNGEYSFAHGFLQNILAIHPHTYRVAQ